MATMQKAKHQNERRVWCQVKQVKFN